jgi:hypothetical protein
MKKFDIERRDRKVSPNIGRRNRDEGEKPGIYAV